MGEQFAGKGVRGSLGFNAQRDLSIGTKFVKIGDTLLL